MPGLVIVRAPFPVLWGAPLGVRLVINTLTPTITLTLALILIQNPPFYLNKFIK